MRLTASITAAAFVLVAGLARASSPIPSNYVDDFGPLTPSTPSETRAARPIAHASPIPLNYIDDFGVEQQTSEKENRETSEPRATVQGPAEEPPVPGT